MVDEEKNKYVKYVTYAKEYLPVISVVFIFVGYWNLDNYYSHFDIQIYNYISAAEILLGFLPISKFIFSFGLIVFIASAIPAFFRFFILSSPKKEYERRNKIQNNKDNRTSRELALDKLKTRVFLNTFHLTLYIYYIILVVYLAKNYYLLEGGMIRPTISFSFL